MCCMYACMSAQNCSSDEDVHSTHLNRRPSETIVGASIDVHYSWICIHGIGTKPERSTNGNVWMGDRQLTLMTHLWNLPSHVGLYKMTGIFLQVVYIYVSGNTVPFLWKMGIMKMCLWMHVHLLVSLCVLGIHLNIRTGVCMWTCIHMHIYLPWNPSAFTSPTPVIACPNLPYALLGPSIVMVFWSLRVPWRKKG